MTKLGNTVIARGRADDEQYLTNEGERSDQTRNHCGYQSQSGC
ncbi:hypothetical protein [Enterococcus wangshanyuanii]|nr:hypothetical protein [Enterococcus wangshanyuanii]